MRHYMHLSDSELNKIFYKKPEAFDNTTKKNQKILAMNSLQSVTKEQLADGITYLQVMQENLSVLSEALN